MPGSVNLGALNKGDAEEVCWCVVESVASLNDTASSVISVVHFLRDVYGFEDGGDTKTIPNPSFLANGHEGLSPKTRKYFSGRSWKGLGGGAVSLAGGLGSGVTMVDVGGILKEGNAVVTTTGHLIGVKAAGASFKKSETITRWIDAMIKAKAAKLGVRGAGLAGAAIPVPAVGLTVNIASTVAKLGIKLTLGKLLTRTAMEVHWRAYQELVIGRSHGPCGPASAMFFEIFTKRGATRIFGKYDTETLIREPGGWMALEDKLKLI
jgi:hypothetical protein